MAPELKTDVLIVGGGPVGLLIAYGLARQGVDSIVVEKHDKEHQAMYGRACTLFPRTLEMLDQLELLDEMNQIGFVARNSVTYKDGKQVTSRGWHIMYERMHGTFLDFCLNIRQKFSETVYRDAYSRIGGKPFIGWKFEDFAVENGAKEDFKVTSRLTQVSSGDAVTVRSKYIVGADGGSSLVRRLAGIPFEGDSTNLKWVRIDGYFKTNMPNADVGFASIESKSHGNVLWVQLDHGVKRIGFAMTEEMLAQYGNNLTKEQAVAEAIKSMEPFTLEIESVEWWTLYSINQKVAGAFFANQRVLLAGDACHTHSSGAAQGMNTGVHDAVNVAWKLGGVVKGWYGSEILQTYEDERRPVAQHLIELDKAFSATISSTVPEKYKDSRLNTNELLTKLYDETILFTIGIGISYGENIFNRAPTTGMISAGRRGPDALIMAPGSRVPVRLYQVTKNTGKWFVVVFAGRPDVTRDVMSKSVPKLEALQSILPKEMIRFITLSAGSVGDGDSAFQNLRVGNIYFDQDRSGHERYSIATSKGAVVVLRPDGILAYATSLDNVDGVKDFFTGFVSSA
ncbi:3-hydroxybenzoate 4-monooxygenase [Penicillium rolfsii]|nr:3-hydroxybenzoate 4-monooxygenase [Penicillium rolfsii]